MRVSKILRKPNAAVVNFIGALVVWPLMCVRVVLLCSGDGDQDDGADGNVDGGGGIWKVLLLKLLILNMRILQKFCFFLILDLLKMTCSKDD